MDGEKLQNIQDLDEMDREIAYMLQENARIPFTKIAEKLGVSERTVRLRVTQMQENGTLSLVGVINPIKVGLNLQTFILVSVESQWIKEVVEKLNEMHEVRMIALITGEYQLFLDVWTKDYEDLSSWMMNQLYQIKGIRKVNVIPVLKKLKSRFKFLLNED